MYKVLIVDDEEGVRRVLAKAVALKGYGVIVVATGAEALEVAAKERVEVALIDLLLDDMPGLAVMQEIKLIQPGLECIIVTGAGTKDSAISAVNLGAYGFVTKPWDDDMLMTMIKAAVNQVETTRSLRESEARLKQLLSETDQA